MQVFKNNRFTMWLLALSLASLASGFWLSRGWLGVAGAAGLGCVLWPLVSRNRATKFAASSTASPAAATPFRASRRAAVNPNDTDGLVEQMLAQGRFALLLRPQITGNLGEAHFQAALAALHETMALVPDGEVLLSQMDDESEDNRSGTEAVAERGRLVAVERFFLDRYPITNAQFYEFVAAGGYEQMALWDETIWPAVLDLVDSTGMPAPRYWRNGCFLPGQERHPVVGVNWYEARAYARWIGKRLPSDPEWVKAGSWPVPLSATSRIQRKYPWGDTMDRTKANLWGSGPNRIVPVDEFAAGVSVGGVYQLIGNVWEWTGGNFRGGEYALDELILSTPMKSIRGGAFDTYFDRQATCQFQSGENPLGRRHNIGFRCAVSVHDLVLGRASQTSEASDAAMESVPLAEEAHA